MPDDSTGSVEPDLEKLLTHPCCDPGSIFLWIFPFPYWKYMWILTAVRNDHSSHELGFNSVTSQRGCIIHLDLGTSN